MGQHDRLSGSPHDKSATARVAGNYREMLKRVLSRNPSPVGRVGGILDVSSVGGSVASDVDKHRVRVGFREVRHPAGLGIETSRGQSFFCSCVCDSAVTEVPHARYHDSAAIVAVRMSLDAGIRWNTQSNRVGARHGRVACDHGCSFGKELGNKLDGRLRIFFHDPMARAGDNAARDVTGNEAQIIRHRRAEGLLGAKGEYRHP